MKLLRSTLCLAAIGMVSGHLNSHLITNPEDVGAEEYDGMGFRFLADGSGVITPPPPTPTTAAPKTTAPPPPPTTAAPVTNKPTTAPPVTEAPATTAPATQAPTMAPTTAPPNTSAGSGSSASTKKTNPPPATQKPRVDNNKSTENSTDANPSNQVTDTPAPSVDADTANVSTEKKMSTGVVAGIVAGIVGGVALLGLIVVSIIRRRRDDDDDPLSPFELSTDKSHTAPALLGSSVGGYGGSYNQKNTNTVYTNHTTQYNGNNHAYAAGAAAAGGASVVATRARKNDTISSSSSSVAGRRTQAATSQQFYDSVTSPNGVHVRPQPNLYHSKLSSNDSDVDVHAKDSSNLWLSAMEAQTAANTQQANDVEGYPRDTEGAYSPRNSYDDVPSYDIDIDQSSVISGGSDLDKEIPDLVESSSRGSYEL